jgi:CHAT domain-containing protein/tetratricopeptide (TPR) repeat protein
MTRRSHYSKSVLLCVLGITIPAWCGMAAACRRPPERSTQLAAVHQALVSGKYAEAERLAADQTARAEADDGPDSLAVGRALDSLIEARIKNGYAGASDILPLAERAVRLKERHLGRTDPETAVSLHNLASLHEQRGEFSAALPLVERSLTIRTAAFDADDPMIADSLDQLGLVLIELERFKEAEPRLTQSLRTREARSAQSPLAVARTLEFIALLHRNTAKYAAAVPVIDRALDIRKRLAGDHPDSLFALQIRGDLYSFMGDAASAQRTWSSALELGGRTLRAEHPAIAQVLRRLGYVAFALGNLTDARRLRQRALKIGEQSLAPCDPALAALVNAVGISLQNDGEYLAARKVYRTALDTVRACRQARSSDLTADEEATLLLNEGESALRVGDLAEADALYQRAVDTWSKGLRPDHPYVAKGLDAVAEVAALRGKPATALSLYEHALRIRRQELREDHPQVAWTLTNLARTMADMGNLAGALQQLNRALAIYKKSGSSDEPDHLARVFELKGLLETRQGRLDAARASLDQAMAERRRIFGERHPIVAETRAILATNDLLRGHVPAALRGALEAEHSGREHLAFTVRYLPERQALFYAAKRPRGLDLALTVAANRSVADSTGVFDAVIHSRGIVLDELAARHRGTSTSDAETGKLLAGALAARQRFANLMVRSLQASVARAILDDAQKDKEEAERLLAERNVAGRVDPKQPPIGLGEIVAALPARSVLVSFVRYERTVDIKRAIAGSKPAVTSYIAFIVRPASRRPVVVPLGQADLIEPAIAEWRKQVTRPAMRAKDDPSLETDFRLLGDRLRRELWDPLEPHVRGSDLILVVPDGAINLVNFAALPIGPTEYWIDRGPLIQYLTTERDVVQLADVKPAAAKGLLALGGVTFGQGIARDNSGSLATSGADASAQLRTGCGLRSQPFIPLPATLKEVNEIARRWEASTSSSSRTVDVLTGRAATEGAFKAQAAGHRVLHLATHGFFLGGECAPSAASTQGPGAVVTAGWDAPVTYVENPLLQTGLALAGANLRAQAKPTEDDGILTAEEVAALNLDGIEWAVLSACDTGLGIIQAGEGVFGLRRAFQIAGARTVIMSLWSVEDEITRDWMRALYEGRLERRLGTAAAIRDASLAVLRDRRARARSTHPFFWAGFVAAGDWK